MRKLRFHFIISCSDMLFSSKEIMAEVSRKEKEAKIVPDPEVDTYMKVHNESSYCNFP